MCQFAEDQKLAELLCAATAFKDRKDWDSAIRAMSQAKGLMLISPVVYPTETWCKYPLYLQQAGRFEEAMKEFQFLLDDLVRRVRRDFRVDDPTVGRLHEKIELSNRYIPIEEAVICKKRELAMARQAKLVSTY